MTRVYRIFLALVLAFVLGLTSHSLATARGMTGFAGQVEICTGSGPVMISVDEDGQPVGAPHFCPDCALHLLSGVMPPETGLNPVSTACDLHPSCAAHVAPSLPPIAATARGPPCMV